MMKQLCIKKLNTRPVAADRVPSVLDAAGVSFEQIDVANWADSYPYKPAVAFRMAHTGHELIIHYRVSEQSVRAVAPHDNGHVWEDSCCEFFSQPAGDGTYYNIECNCAGTLLVGCGSGREGRALAPQAVLDKVERWSSLGREPFEERCEQTDWQMALIIPLTTFFQHDIEPLSGKTVRANFYKCGDEQQQAHFLSWNPINIENPDFHRPDFFGELVFE